MTSSNGNNFGVTGLCVGNSLVTGEFPSQRPMIQSLDVFFDLHLNKWLSKPSNRRWFNVALCSLWSHWMCWLIVVYRGIYASKNWVIIGSGCGLWPVPCQAITRPNADLLLLGLMGTNRKIWIKILAFCLRKMLSVIWFGSFCVIDTLYGGIEYRQNFTHKIYNWEVLINKYSLALSA